MFLLGCLLKKNKQSLCPGSPGKQWKRKKKKELLGKISLIYLFV